MNKQFTQKETLPGYWVDAKGIMTPEHLIKPIDKERDALVGQIVTAALHLSHLLTEFKQAAFGDVEAFKDLSAEQYGVAAGGAKGNLSLVSFDGRYKVQRANQDHINFDERIQAAKALIDECVNDWIQDARPEVRVIVEAAFATDKEGNINVGKVLGLRRLDIQDERWQRAMQAIGEAVQVTGSKLYMRIYQRVGDTNKYDHVPLDIAGV